MNVGDLVKITLKSNRDLFISGVVKSLEDDYVYAIATTVRGDIVLDGEDYDVEVLRAVEPAKIGSVHVDRHGMRWTKFTDCPSYVRQWISERGDIRSWNYLEVDQ